MVKIKYILITVFFICTEIVYAQYYEMGKRRLLNARDFSEAYCGLYLQKDKYFILLTEGTSELSSSSFVSYGRVCKKDNMYYLKDIPCNAEIVLEASGDMSNLVIRKGFSFMQNERFWYQGDIIDDDLESMVDIESVYIRKRERNLHKRKHKISSSPPLRLGVYENKSITLSLDSDYLYQIHYKLNEYSQIVSKGKWIKDGNLLKLYDAFLDCSFTALIDSSKITVIDFPNDVYSDYDYLPVEEKMLPLIVK